MKDPGTVGRLDLLAATTNQGWFADFHILACHTGRDVLTDTFAVNYDGNDPVPVLVCDTLDIAVSLDEWEEFVFDTPFEYNGTDNLLLEFHWPVSYTHLTLPTN